MVCIMMVDLLGTQRCTHRPSLLPIEFSSYAFGAWEHRLARVDLSGKVLITARFRGSRSRNKVIVGEPAFGSLTCWRCGDNTAEAESRLTHVG